MSENPVLIGRLRITGAGPDPLLTRLRTSYLLDAVDLRAPSLPPAAVLCVRTLRDPLPLRLHLDTAHALPERAWQQAIIDQLDGLARRAVRPLLGGVPSSAEAVVFADRSEMLACLAIDWLRGRILNHWWWRRLLPAADTRTAVLQMWQDSPEFVPAALAHVRDRDDVTAWVQVLTDAEVEQLTRLVIERFGLSALHDRVITRQARLPRTDEPERTAIAGEVIGAAAHGSPGELPPSIPFRWAGLVPAAGREMAVHRQVLLAVGLCLHHDPAAARTAQFADQVSYWIETLAASSARPLPLPGQRSRRKSPPLAAQPDFPDESAPGDIPAQPPGGAVAPPGDVSWPSPDLTPLPDASERPLYVGSAPDEIRDTLEPPEWVETRCGGLFYLVNVAIAFGLYGDFTNPQSPGIDLPIWDFLALTGEALLGDGLRQDPVWPLLASLSGRGDRPPGSSYDAPTEWRAPSSWTTDFEPAPCRWTAAGHRLRVAHPSGFWLLDVPAGPDLAAQLEGELPVEIWSSLEPGHVPAPRRGRLKRWVDWWTAYMQARLLSGLGLDNEDDLPAVLFSCFARIFVSAARLDVVFRLDEVSLAVRMAGLDRDPGWVPAAGRWIAFRFE